MALTARITRPDVWLTFQWEFAECGSTATRTALCRRCLNTLLPKNPRRAAKTDWQVIDRGIGSLGLRLAIVETVHGEPGARLWLIAGGYVLQSVRADSPQAARLMSAVYNWRASENYR